jgi:lysophospholipase L1-like esterase
MIFLRASLARRVCPIPLRSGSHRQPREATDRIRLVALATLIGLLHVCSASSDAAAAALRLGVLGDSMSAGDGSDFGSYPNWVTQLSTSGVFSVGPLGNQAVGGAVSADVINSQLPAIQSQIAAGQLDYTVLMIGANDAAYAAANYLQTGDLNAAIQGLINSVVPNVETTLTAIANTGSVHQILVNIPDQTVAPLVQSLFAQYHATPAQIASVRAGIQSVNSQITTFALAHGIPVIDMFTATDTIIAHPPLKLAGVSFTNLFASDGYHPSAVDNGLIANAVIIAANLQYHAGLARISDQQIVRNVGQTPLKLTPTFYNMTPYVTVAAPEPSTLVLGLAGLTGLGFSAVRKKHRPA